MSTTLIIAEVETILTELGLKTPIPHFSAADVLNKPLDIARCYLADTLASLIECDPEVAYKSIQWPNNIYNGDLSVVLPRIKPGCDADEFAFDLMTKFSCPLFVLPIPDGVHLRIMFDPISLQRLLLPFILSRNASYGLNTSLGLQNPSTPKKLVVEFSSPNIASEFQSRHLRSTLLGAHIANLYSSMGWEVTRLNYLGDWGKPIGLLGVGWEKFGSELLFEKDPVGHLHEVYKKISDLFAPEEAASKKARDESKKSKDESTDTAEIEGQGIYAERNAYFKRLEDGEPAAIALWKRAREASIENYAKQYARLNITFDEYSGESQVTPETIAEVERILKEKGLLEESGGSSIIDMKKHKEKSGTVIIRDRAGSSTYILRELASVIERSRKYLFDKMIYVVAADSNLMHFTRMFKILSLMGMSELASKLQHMHFNPASQVPTNEDMLGGALGKCEMAMAESLKENPEEAAVFGNVDAAVAAMAVSALIVQEVSARRANDHAFDISQMTSFEPGTGPNLQYWYARLCSTIKSGLNEDFATLKISSHGRQDSVIGSDMKKVDEINTGEQVDLMRLLVQYPDIVQTTYNTFEPATLMKYLTDITTQLSLCLEMSQGRLLEIPVEGILYEATRNVLESGMKLLGLTPFVKNDVV